MAANIPINTGIEPENELDCASNMIHFTGHKSMVPLCCVPRNIRIQRYAQLLNPDMLQPTDAMANRWTRQSSERPSMSLSVRVIHCTVRNSGGDEVGENDAEGRLELMKPTSSSNEKVMVMVGLDTGNCCRGHGSGQISHFQSTCD